jgi:beta-phosphoglucomutase
MQHGVIFDMDGVLVDSGPAHVESWRVLARQHGLTMSDEEFVSCFGQTSRDIIRRFWGDGVSDEEIARHDNEKERIYRELITGRVPLMDGTREMLVALREAGFMLAVATSGPRENVELVLREGELGAFFDAVVTGFDVKKGKPAPDCFLLAAERAGLPPERCVVVEDAPVGIQAALAAGMPAIGFVGTHPAERLTQAGAARVVDRLAEITPGMVSDLLGTQ